MSVTFNKMRDFNTTIRVYYAVSIFWVGVFRSNSMNGWGSIIGREGFIEWEGFIKQEGFIEWEGLLNGREGFLEQERFFTSVPR